jgi:hypothetical protein
MILQYVGRAWFFPQIVSPTMSKLLGGGQAYGIFLNGFLFALNP